MYSKIIKILFLLYYLFMSGFTVYIQELPLTFNIFDFKLIKNTIKEYCEYLTMNSFSSRQHHGEVTILETGLLR